LAGARHSDAAAGESDQRTVHCLLDDAAHVIGGEGCSSGAVGAATVVGHLAGPDFSGEMLCMVDGGPPLSRLAFRCMTGWWLLADLSFFAREAGWLAYSSL
jgi:hypothetical protein